ncbi:trans-sialidase, putative [Trypanosoma cruzi]|nr:trans-sialidase, putative [Trypanosoma cruzi]
MLSRVAAVKAPRTHSRRRVTGSSGSRREGGESERPRPDMSRHLFCFAVLLLIVVMMCCGSEGAAEAAGQSSQKKFEWKVITEGETVESLGAPGLLNVGSDVFAVAEAQCKKNGESNSFTGVASQIISKQTANSPMEVLKNPKDTQLLEEGTSEDSKKVDVTRPTTVVKGNDIYMLAGTYSSNPTDVCQDGADVATLNLLLVRGQVSDEENKKIDWKDVHTLPCTFLNQEHKSWTRLTGGGGSGVTMEDGKLLFPVEGTKEGDAPNGKKAISLLIYSLDTDESWKLSKEAPDGGCSDPSVVEWGEKDKKLIMMTACDDGRRRVYESGDMGEEWTEALGTLSRVWGSKKGNVKGVRSGFITAKIDDDEDNRNVMLVTLPVYAENDGKEKGKIHLWLTDNTHIVDIGPVSDDDAAASSLLYRSAGSGDNEKEELIALYEKKKGDEKPSPGMVSVLLTEQLQRVKEVLATWKEVDKSVSKLCPSAKKDAPTGTPCSTTVKITDGLVGFLSGNFSENTWSDEYLGMNATVKGNDEGNKAKLHEGSVKFTGAWAEWPVGSQGENQLYHFANYNFTLVATVSIDKVLQEEEGFPISLLGVHLEGKDKLMELSYDKEKKKWKLLCGEEMPKELSSTSEKETTHHVVILLRNGTQGSAYVDGQPVGEDLPCALGNKDLKEISHFFIGGDGNSAGGAGSEEVSVTVTNVLLYNRPLNDDEITALNTKLSIPKTKETKTVKEVTPPEEIKQATLETGAPSSLVGQQQTEQDSLKKSKVVGSGGLSTSAVSSVTNSPAAKESDNQSASGTFPEGHPNVDVDSSSEEVQTVDAKTGDTMQEDGTQQPSAGTSAAADTNAPTAETMAHDGTAVTPEFGAHSGEDGETVGRTDGQKGEDIHAREGEVKAAALSSSLGNVSQGNNSDAGSVCGSGLLLILLLGLWVFAAL